MKQQPPGAIRAAVLYGWKTRIENVSCFGEALQFAVITDIIYRIMIWRKGA